jgi:PAS domain S-box-containing protein
MSKSKLWLDCLAVGLLGLLLVTSMFVVDWLPTLLGAPASPRQLDGSEAGLVAVYFILATAYLGFRATRPSRTHEEQPAHVTGVQAASIALLVEDFLHKAGGEAAAQAYIKSILDHAQKMTQATGAAIHLIEGDDLVYKYAGGTPPPNVGREPLGRTVAGTAARQNQPLVVRNARADPRMSTGIPGQVPYASMIIVPVTYSGRVLGTLRLIHAEPNTFQESDGDVLRPVAALLGAALWRAHDADEREGLQRERDEAARRAQTAEQRFDLLAERLQRGLLITDPHQASTALVTPRAAQILGQDLDALSLNPRLALEAIHPEDRARVAKERAALGNEGGELHYQVARAGGALAWVREDVVFVRDDKKQVRSIISVLHDETQEMDLLARAEGLQRHLEVPLKDAPIVFFALRPDGDHGMTYVSPNVANLLGHRASDFLTDPAFWTALLHPDDQSPVFAEFPKLFEEGSLIHQYRIRHADGSYKTLEDHMTLIRTPEGVPLEIVGFWADASERRRTEEGVQYSLNRIKELQDSRTRLLNTISHDLANPITPIRLQLHMLQTALKGRPEARNLDIVSRNVETLNRLILDLKDLARLEAGQLKVDLEPADLLDLVKAAIDSFQGAAIEKGIVLEARLGSSVTLPLDEQRITQVLFNFLSNALKFTPSGGTITVHATHDPTDASVRVTDSGRGLTPEEMAKLFKPFSQVHERSEVSEKGTGLGLFICKGLIEGHGGRIFVESPGHGKGSTFGFKIPIAGASATPPTAAGTPAAVGRPAPQPAPSPPAPKAPRKRSPSENKARKPRP